MTSTRCSVTLPAKIFWSSSKSPGEKSNRTALVQEIQHSPVVGDVLHIDFHAISMDEKIQADVPLEAVGIANGVKNFGGLLEQNLRSLTIECLPTRFAGSRLRLM